MEKIIYSIVYIKENPAGLDLLLKGLKGIYGAGLFTVSFDQIFAVISEIDKAGLVTDRINAITYAGVVEVLAHQFTLLPMRYGSVMESSASIRKMLEKNHAEMLQNLQQVENKCEFGLKVFSDPENIESKILARSEAENQTPVSTVPETETSVFRDYVNIKLKAHRLEELRLTIVTSMIEEITAYLSGLNPISKTKKLVAATTLIDAVFLMDKEQKNTMIDAVSYMQARYPELNFVLTGPWPPYSFVDITIK